MKQLSYIVNIHLIILLIHVHFVADAQDTMRFMGYNILNYYDDIADTTARNPAFRSIFSYTQPDILAVTEIKDEQSANVFFDAVIHPRKFNFVQAPFTSGPNTSGILYYDQTTYSCLSNSPITTVLRDINHFVMKHLETEELFHIFLVHLKASSGIVNEDIRASEVDSLRKVSNQLAVGTPYFVCGDFNIYGDFENAYQKLLQVNSNQKGHFIDPLSLTGTWNNAGYAIHHTQSPRERAFGGGITGGLDDRFDMILHSASIQSGGPLLYVPQSMAAIGNDGQHYNDSVNRMPNLAVPQLIAQALHDAADHLPVFGKYIFVNGTSGRIDHSLSPLVVHIFPNPGFEYVQFESTLEISEIIAVDLMGRVFPIDFRENCARIEFLLPGIYTLEFRSDLNVIRKIFIKS